MEKLNQQANQNDPAQNAADEQQTQFLKELVKDLDDDIFELHQSTLNKIILTEAQFNLVKKVYERSFIEHKFSLTDNSFIL